jgi:hypothetical protein
MRQKHVRFWFDHNDQKLRDNMFMEQLRNNPPINMHKERARVFVQTAWDHDREWFVAQQTVAMLRLREHGVLLQTSLPKLLSFTWSELLELPCSRRRLAFLGVATLWWQIDGTEVFAVDAILKKPPFSNERSQWRAYKTEHPL